MPDRILNERDHRCDSCGAAAYLQVHLTNGPLLFCKHHGDENDSMLLDYRWDDDRWALVAKLDVSP